MKKLTFLLSVCLFLTCLTGCTSMQSSTAEPINISATSVEVSPSKSDAPVVPINKENLLPGLKKIVEKGTLTVAMINDEIPVFCETQSDGSMAGIDVNLAQELANSLGVTLTINRESNTYDELTDLLVKGAVDLVISTYSLTTERAACVSISNPYLTTRIGVMVNKQELVKNRIEKNPIDYMKSNNIKLAAIRHSAHVSMLSEMFPLRVRGLAMSIAGFALWIGTYLIGQLTPWMLKHLTPEGTFLLFAGMCLPYLLIMWRWVPETTGRSLEEIERSNV